MPDWLRKLFGLKTRQEEKAELERIAEQRIMRERISRELKAGPASHILASWPIARRFTAQALIALFAANVLTWLSPMMLHPS